MSLSHTRVQARNSTVMSTVSSDYTTVDIDDMLQQYERLLLQLSQQLLEQEEDIHTLRTALHASQHRQRRRRRRGGGGGGKLNGTAVALTTESLSVPVEGSQHHHTHHAAAKAATQLKITHGDSQLHLTAPVPSTPQVSSIDSAEDMDVGSTMEFSPESTAMTRHSPERSAAGAAVPLLMSSTGKPSGQRGTSAALACSSTMCDVSSLSDKTNVGLTPSPVHDCRPPGETATVGSFWTSSRLSVLEKSSHGSALARRRRTSAQLTRDAPFETPQVKFDGQDAMSYLLSVFSNVKSECKADGAETEGMAKPRERASCGREDYVGTDVRSPSTPLQQHRQHVSRQLFHLDPVHEDEGSESGNEHPNGGAVLDYRRPAPWRPLLPPPHDKRSNGDGSAIATHNLDCTVDKESRPWQERYARIVACALAAEFMASNTAMGEDQAEQQQRGGETGSRTSTAARCRTTSLHDHSASAIVTELLRLFTLEPTTGHQSETDGKDFS
ncbi:hypothetical protein Q4I30_001710 [Leishmania utingensis]|uniref:Uncharacterized protein n=1 Tax=Leishmania utingensis TaxID=653362 RepID=A0AAW3AT72_9TRYP